MNTRLVATLVIVALFIVAAIVGSRAGRSDGRRRGSRLQRRLFFLFLSLSLLPAVLTLAVNWQMSQRQLDFLDSPGLEDAMESALALARASLERESDATLRLADALAEALAGGRTAADAVGALAPAGTLLLWQDELVFAPGKGISAPPASAIATMAEPGGASDAGESTGRVRIGDSQYLLAIAPSLSGGETLRVARPLPEKLARELTAITQGGSRYRQLGLYYSRMLRTDTLITLAAIGLAILAVSLFLSRRLARQIGAPIGELTRGTQIVAGGDLSHRVDVAGPDELGDLVAAFNRMTADLGRSKEELLRAERIAAWQGIARRLAHEIKNPLTPIELSMHRIGRKVDDPTVNECVAVVLEEAANLGRLADEFSAFARLPLPEKSECNLAELVRETAEFHAARGMIEIESDNLPKQLIVAADAGQMRQVFGNLIKNAVEAMGGRGTLGLKAEGDSASVSITVFDDGPGLTSAADELFEPYYTTKPTGTGLGLAITRKIVTDHGGELSAGESEMGGAAFTVVLPREAQPPDQRSGSEDE